MTDKLWEHYMKGGTPGEAIALKLAAKKRAYAVWSRWRFAKLWHELGDWFALNLSERSVSQIRGLLVENLRNTRMEGRQVPQRKGNRPYDTPHKASSLPNRGSSQKQGEVENDENQEE